MPLVTIPKKLEGMNKSERYILNKLKQLYMVEPHISYLYLEPKIKNFTPDFILIDPIRGVAIIEVKAWSIEYIDTINAKEVTSIKGDRLENPAYKTRRYFNTLSGVFHLHPELIDDKNQLKMKLHSLLVLTEIREEELIELKIDAFFNHYPARVLFKEMLPKLTLDELFDNTIEAIDPTLIEAIRVAIFPEIKIVHPSNDGNHDVDKQILALDIEQERFAKSLPLGHYMITGIPGSGKTVTLLSRAIYLAKLYPEWNILILTYNKVLKTQLTFKIERIKEDLDLLDISIHNIEVVTFHQKAMELSSLSPQAYKENAEEFWKTTLPNDAILNAKPRYHAILIDEYQDFYKEWFALVLKLLIRVEESGTIYTNLFLAGDRLQSIYNPKEINWKRDIGLDMRGRSKLLKTSYRVTQEHITLGFSMLLDNNLYEREVDEFYEKGKDIVLKNIQKNSIELLEERYLSISKLFQQLLGEYEYEDILLLAPTWQMVNAIKRTLPYEIQQHIISSKVLKEKKSIFTTYHSSKGIESKVTIVVNPERIEERKLLYVAVTRASHRLIIYTENSHDNIISSEFYRLQERQKEKLDS